MIIAFPLLVLSTVLGFIDEAFDCDLILYRFVLVPSSVHSGILRHLCASASVFRPSRAQRLLSFTMASSPRPTRVPSYGDRVTPSAALCASAGLRPTSHNAIVFFFQSLWAGDHEWESFMVIALNAMDEDGEKDPFIRVTLEHGWLLGWRMPNAKDVVGASDPPSLANPLHPSAPPLPPFLRPASPKRSRPPSKAASPSASAARPEVSSHSASHRVCDGGTLPSGTAPLLNSMAASLPLDDTHTW